jgi:1-acyl-sn-glycerol-3-phosphate acyltransferase
MKKIAEVIGQKTAPERHIARNVALFSLLAAPLGVLALALRPNPRQMWRQRWPTLTFVGLYQIALDRFVEIIGLENIPKTGPVILAGNHISKTAMDAMLMGSRLLIERGGLAKFVSQADPPDPMLKRFVRLMGNGSGVILPISKGMTTDTMIHFLQHPEEFNREQSILGIFPAGEADSDFDQQMQRTWHTSAAVAACETGAPIVPFFVEGLPSHWSPFDMLKAVARSSSGKKAFCFKVRFGPPLLPPEDKTPSGYIALTERLRNEVLRMAAESERSREAATVL